MAMILLASLTGYGYWYGGRSFVASLAAFGMLLAGMLLFAARGVVDRVAAAGAGGGWLLGITIFLIYLLYVLGTGAVSFIRLGEMAVFLFASLALLRTAGNAAAGTWQDFFVVAGVWAAVKFGPSHSLWPYPGGRLAYIFTILAAVNSAIAGFLILRRVKGVGYNIGWGGGWPFSVLASLLAFACIAIPLGVKLHFIAFDFHAHPWKDLPALTIGILFFTAWPEEFLFRGLLQNLLARASKNEFAGWWTASLLFGFSHITNGGFPNWRYVILASIAGFFYGWTWRRTGSIFASALVHAAVDVLWHFFFRTM
jgi:membrane protease YdiL (CAAX protease family)